jgi:hypothetical protein
MSGMPMHQRDERYAHASPCIQRGSMRMHLLVPRGSIRMPPALVGTLYSSTQVKPPTCPKLSQALEKFSPITASLPLSLPHTHGMPGTQHRRPFSRSSSL